MREITVKLYQFDELSEQAKDKAREWARDDQGMRGQYEFDYLIEDAKMVSLAIHRLDDHRANEGEFIGSARDTVELILKNHGVHCETYQTAVRYQADLDRLFKLASNEETQKTEDAYADCMHEFLHDLLEDYRVLYNQGIEYVYSQEAIDEDIKANEYEFTEGGKRA
jgi:hypothetical protein